MVNIFKSVMEYFQLVGIIILAGILLFQIVFADKNVVQNETEALIYVDNVVVKNKYFSEIYSVLGMTENHFPKYRTLVKQKLGIPLQIDYDHDQKSLSSTWYVPKGKERAVLWLLAQTDIHKYRGMINIEFLPFVGNRIAQGTTCSGGGRRGRNAARERSWENQRTLGAKGLAYILRGNRHITKTQIKILENHGHFKIQLQLQCTPKKYCSDTNNVQSILRLVKLCSSLGLGTQDIIFLSPKEIAMDLVQTRAPIPELKLS